MATQEAQLPIIRDITKISEMREVEHLQKEVWGVADREVFPALALIPMLEVGGVLIGAFDGDRMAGFVFGFMGRESGKTILHSDMLAVRPEYRSHGLGYKLKLAQRDRALANGIETITWTFDPLQSLNAHLNFSKLGVTANRYCVNYYGETTSFLHRAGTDRLWVTWSLRSQRAEKIIAEQVTPSLPNLQSLEPLVRVAADGEPQSQVTRIAEQPFLIEIPANINEMLEQKPERALRWREATRSAFTKAMDAGFVVEEFARGRSGTGVYLLNPNHEQSDKGKM